MTASELPSSSEVALSANRLDIPAIEARGEFTTDDLRVLLELGAGRLPPIEQGTMAHGGKERANLEARAEYLGHALGIDAGQISHPLEDGKSLSRRLVADVLVDIITACQTAQDLVDQMGNSVDRARIESYLEVVIRPFNELMQTRRAKGLQADIRLPDGRTIRDVALSRNYAPARGDDLIRGGYFAAMLEVLEAKLLKKQVIKPETTPPAS
jgi:hypothetical protein